MTGGPAGGGAGPGAGTEAAAAAWAGAERRAGRRALALHLGLVLALLAGHWLLPAWHHTAVARIMVLAVYAMGYNLAFGYAGMLSLGHALYFALGLYGAGLPVALLGWPAAAGLLAGTLAGGAGAGLIGLVALRTSGVSFMIVTLMLAQAGHLVLLWLTPLTRGEEGFVIAAGLRRIGGLDLAAEGPRYLALFGLFALALGLAFVLARAPFGRVMVAMRENEERSRMLGYDPYRTRAAAFALSGLYAGAAGAAYGLAFGYVGAGFAASQYSILPLLWVLLGGAGSVLGPVLGTGAMFYLIDWASGVTRAPFLVVGAVLLALVLFAPRGIVGWLRDRGAGRWLP